MRLLGAPTKALKVDCNVARLAGTKAGVHLAPELTGVILLQLQLNLKHQTSRYVVDRAKLEPYIVELSQVKILEIFNFSTFLFGYLPKLEFSFRVI